jgi:hypothetical protein
MTTNFITFYLIIVLITGPFFYFLPIPTTLLWDEILLAKILNQAPTIFLMSYLLFLRKKVKQLDIFVLLIVFLALNVFPEAYYYFINPKIIFSVIVVHNTVSYVLLIALLLRKNFSFKKELFLYAFLLSGLITLGFSFSAYSIFQVYLLPQPIVFFILILFIIIAISVIFLSFFAEKPFQRNWYEMILGIIFLLLVDIYTYSCVFVFETDPILLFTFGKIFVSIGTLLLADSVLRRVIKNNASLVL